jgi:hypothetical protein
MKIITRDLVRGKDAFYVVTRDGRRIEDKNYKTQTDAQYRADVLYGVLKKYDPNDLGKIAIVKTSNTYRIY